MRFWKVVLLGGGLILAGWLGWLYSNEQTATLVALNTHTGQLAWMHPFTDTTDSFSRGPIAADGKVLVDFIQSLNSEKKTGDSRPFYQLQALDTRSGQLLWTYHLPKKVYTSFDLKTKQSIIFEANQLYLQFGGELRSLDPATGKQRWAIKRPWFDGLFAPSMGLAVLPQDVSVISANKRERSLQFLDPKTGKVRRQTKFILDPLTTTRDLIAADDRSVFLETAGLIQTGKDSYHNSGRAAVTAYDIKTGAVRFQTEIPESGGISNLQAESDGLQLRSHDYYSPKQGKITAGLALLAIDSETGRIRWRKPYKQIPCLYDGQSWRVDADSIYLNCGEPLSGSTSSTIVALSTQTGNVKWRTQVGLASSSLTQVQNSAVSAQQFLTFRQIQTSQSVQTQAIALDRQTGKLLWSFPLTSDRYVDQLRQVVAAEGDRFFFLDFVPRWQIWLWQINPAFGAASSKA
jgi:outer membrane protein assembly factor BamB